MYTIYVDLDDTLLNNNKEISDYTYNVLTEFQKRGNAIVFTTARSKQLHKLQDKLKRLTPYLILHNGGEVVVDGKIIYQNYFTPEETKRIGGYLTANKIKTAVILDKKYYANYDAQAVWGKIENFIFTDYVSTSVGAPKFSVMLDKKSQMDIIDELKACACITYIDGFTNAVISPKTASKGAAIKFCNENLFDGYTSIYIGNDYNDISGFEACNIKVAVANAEDELLKRADIIIGSNENDGVARYVSTLM